MNSIPALTIKSQNTCPNKGVEIEDMSESFMCVCLEEGGAGGGVTYEGTNAFWICSLAVALWKK